MDRAYLIDIAYWLLYISHEGLVEYARYSSITKLIKFKIVNSSTVQLFALTHKVRSRSQTTLTRFWLLTNYPLALTFFVEWTLTKKLYFWTTYLHYVVCEWPQHIYCIVGIRSRLKDISTPDISTPSFNPRPFNPGLESLGWRSLGLKVHGRKVWGWMVWVWSLGLKSLGLKCPSTIPVY